MSLQADKADYNSVDALEDCSALFDCSFRPDHQLSRMNSLEEHSGIIPRWGHDHFVTKSFAVIRPPVALNITRSFVWVIDSIMKQTTENYVKMYYRVAYSFFFKLLCGVLSVICIVLSTSCFFFRIFLRLVFILYGQFFHIYHEYFIVYLFSIWWTYFLKFIFDVVASQ